MAGDPGRGISSGLGDLGRGIFEEMLSHSLAASSTSALTVLDVCFKGIRDSSLSIIVSVAVSVVTGSAASGCGLSPRLSGRGI